MGLAVSPGNGILTGEEDGKPWDLNLRLLADGFVGENWRAWVNILENVRTVSVLPPVARSTVVGVERSSLFSWEQDDRGSAQAAMVLDAGYAAWGSDHGELTLGRQPVQFSVTNYYTPNDFFAPFAAQHFYRVYKPGVDAIRYEGRLADLAQFSLVGVLGYDEDLGAENGWSRAPLWRRTSLLGRYARSLGGLEWGTLVGVVRESEVIGASLQGELTDWLGVRAEGHYRDSSREGVPSGTRLSCGLEHRFANNLTLRVEQMYNGTGYASIAEAEQALREDGAERWYLGRHYSAFNLGYEFSPLLTGEFLYLRNWTDSSQVIALYAVFSVGNEAELALQVSLPEGDEPGAQSLGSELGSQPALYALEYRHYF